jgi:type 1 glutamine amidotransferase
MFNSVRRSAGSFGSGLRPRAKIAVTAVAAAWLATALFGTDGLPVARAAESASAGAKVLIVTGEDYKGHKWQQTYPVLQAELAKDPRLTVDAVTELNYLKTGDLAPYDVIVAHFKNYDPELPGRKGYDRLEKFVADGGGLVLTHFACGAFQEFKDDFTRLAGRAWNPKLRGHDPYGEFTVEIADPDHPVTKGLKPFRITDELYTCLDGQTPIHVVATATSKVDQKVYPMAFVLEFGRGRVFHTVLGHNAQAFANAGAAELIRRGTAWTAGLEPVAASKE